MITADTFSKELALWYGLTKAPGESFEVRLVVPGESRPQGCKTFDDPDVAAAWIDSHNVEACHVYATLNPVAPGLSRPVKDSDVLRRRILLVDCDPCRPGKVSATDQEKEAARLKAYTIKTDLSALYDFPDPVVLDSGNGFHLYYRLDRENNAETDAAVVGFLRALASVYSDDKVEIDTSVSNAGRVTKLPSTWAVKGPSTKERPHRLCRFVEVPEDFLSTSVEITSLCSYAEENGLTCVPRESRTMEEPGLKPGAIGAFCRAYSISEAIDAFLPEVYEAAGPDRYTFTQGSTWGGLLVYGDKFAYSHHSTDPCGGREVNSFDLVRLHKFGALDEGLSEDTPTQERPSFLAMLDFARNDTRVATMLSTEAFSGLSDVEEIASETAPSSFPLEVLPAGARAFVEDAFAGLHFPKDYTAASMLVAVAGTLGNAMHVRRTAGHVEPPSLYLFIVGGKGTCKSHPVSLALSPLHEMEEELHKSYLEELALYKMEKELRKGKKTSDDPAPARPIERRFVLGDSTIEALAQALAENGRGLLLYNDEIAAQLKGLNQYKGGHGSDLEALLSIWSGKPIDVTRKTSGHLRAFRPCLSIIGTIQPSIIPGLTRDKEENGFLDRLLFVWPQDVKVESFSVEDKGLPREDLEAWRRALRIIRELPFNGTPGEASLTPEARAIFVSWQNRKALESNRLNAARIRKTDDSAVAGINAKMFSYCLRFSLVLEVLSQAYDGPGYITPSTKITASSMEKAVRLSEYFIGQALEIHKVNHAAALDLLTDSKRQLYEALPDSFAFADGLALAEEAGVPRRTFQRFLKDVTLFKQPSRGTYQKTIINNA